MYLTKGFKTDAFISKSNKGFHFLCWRQGILAPHPWHGSSFVQTILMQKHFYTSILPQMTFIRGDKVKLTLALNKKLPRSSPSLPPSFIWNQTPLLPVFCFCFFPPRPEAAARKSTWNATRSAVVKALTSHHLINDQHNIHIALQICSSISRKNTHMIRNPYGFLSSKTRPSLLHVDVLFVVTNVTFMSVEYYVDLNIISFTAAQFFTPKKCA